MNTARTAPVLDAEFEELGDQRRTDRRSSDRRAPRLRLDPMFAATLVNQIARPEPPAAGGYERKPPGPRAGLVMNVRA
jgi:hypothetical protein